MHSALGKSSPVSTFCQLEYRVPVRKCLQDTSVSSMMNHEDEDSGHDGNKDS